MKVAITCDSLLVRDHSTSLVELLLASYKDAEVYTLSYNPDTLIGPIQDAPIHASFLCHLVKTPRDLARYSFLIPAALKKLFIPCSVDLVIDVSSGLSHAISRCAKSKNLTYVYDFQMPSGHWAGKLFGPNLERLTARELANKKNLRASSEGILRKVPARDLKATVIRPFLELGEFPLAPEGEKDLWVVNVQDWEVGQARELERQMQDSQLKPVLVGKAFQDVHCDGELAPLLARAQGVVDLSHAPFPLFALKALAMGRPVVLADTPVNRSLFKSPGVAFLGPDGVVSEEISTLAKNPIPPQNLRAQSTRFPPLKFKSEMLSSASLC